MCPSNQTNSPIEIMLVSDQNYAPFLATTMVSILKNAAPEDVLSFHIVDAGLSPRDLEIVEGMKSIRPFELHYYKPNLSEFLKLFPDDIGDFPLVCNYRLFLTEFLPQDLDKILYMDVDVVALGSLRELWETPFEDRFVAAAKDKLIPDQQYHLDALELSSDHLYFNSGIMLVNVKKWREDNLLPKILRTSVKIRDKNVYQDQDVINVVADEIGYKKISSTKWICHPTDYVEGETRVLHFMGIRQEHPHLDILTSYAKQTPYGGLPFQKTSYKIKRFFRIISFKIVYFFLFKGKWRRVYRKRFTKR